MSESKLIYSTVLLALAVLAVSAIGQNVLAQPEQPFFTAQADLAWQDSGMSVVAGQSYTLTASGQWTGGLLGFFGPAGDYLGPRL